MTKPEFIIIEPADDYHAQAKAGKFLSSHLLADFRKCPELYRRKLAGEIHEPERRAFLLGRAAHTLILEGQDAFEASFTTDEPINPKTGKAYGKTTNAYASWAELQKKDVISLADYVFCKRLELSVKAHHKAARLLSKGIAEGVIRANHSGMACQIRMDYFSESHGLIDLKTCDDLSYFEADSRRYGYIHQLAFYRAVLQEASRIKYPVHIIAVEKKQPFRTGVWCIAPHALDFAEQENAAAINRLKNCLTSGVWPTGYEEIRILNNL